MFPEPVVVWKAVIGQERAVSRLKAAAASPVHAYLLVGPAGSCVREAAVAFAAELMGPEERDQRLVLAGEHPDVRMIERVGASISTDQAEEVIRLASLAPVEGRRKVMILDEFHLLAPAAAAKLLKTVEEPSRSTVFVIVAEDVPPELVTIASRCVKVEFGPLSARSIADALNAEGVEPSSAIDIARMAAGNLHRARLLAADPGAAARWAAFTSIPSRLDDSGHVVMTIVDEVVGLIEAAAAPLTAQHEREDAQLAERLEQTGERGTGLRKALEDRHKRELRRHRTDELRSGLSALSASYRDALVAGTAHEPGAVIEAVGRITAASEALDRNPNETLLLQSLLLSLPST